MQKTQEGQLMTSKELRDKVITNNENVLDKIKVVPLLPSTLCLGIIQAANYYNVDKEAIKNIIRKNREELENDGLRVIFGEELTKLKNLKAIDSNTSELYIGTKNRSYTILTKRALLRMGMLLRKSDVATTLRAYLLNIEENASLFQKQEAIDKIEINNKSIIVNNSKIIDTKKLELQELQILVKREELESKQELIQSKKLLKKLIMFGVPKAEAALLVQQSIMNSSNPEKTICEKIEELFELEKFRERGVIRLKIDTLADNYYFGKREAVYHEFSERMKYHIGIDMMAIRRRAKKKYGDKSKEVPSYLDLIANNRAHNIANKVLSLILRDSVNK